jgi:glycosyltransferase involved in cell wall biosynthesis
MPFSDVAARPSSRSSPPSICFVGLGNLPVLTRGLAAPRVGGAELQQTLLAKALSRRGWPVSMVVADHGQPDGAVWDGIRTFRAYRPDAGIPLVRFIHPRWTGLHAAMARADAQIYYTSCAGAHLAQVVLFARCRGRKVAFRIASNSDCNPRELLVQYWRDRLLYRYGLTHADVVLAQTADQQRALSENFARASGIAPALIEHGGHCRDFDARDIDVLWVGNIRAVKRPDLLLQAARSLPQIRFHMVGGPMPGAARLFEASRREAASLPNVTFHGAVPYHDVQALYERARILVSTSEVEGFPNAYLQAWDRGAPVVGFLDPDGLLGRFCMGRAVRNMEEMGAAIATLSRDRPQWQQASARAREYMEQRSDEEKALAPYLAALTGLCNASAGAPAAIEARAARG